MVERIVSLAPSITTIIRELGAEDRLVGVTQHDTGGGEVVGGWLTPDIEKIAALDPDIVLTTDAMQERIADTLRERWIRTAHFSPETISEVYQYIREVGELIGREAEAESVAMDMEERIATVEERVSGHPRPVVYCEEWDEPPMVAGNWVPDVIRIAGGRYPFCQPGERSRRIDSDEIAEASPEIGMMHICGRGTDADPEMIARRGWTIPEVHVIHDDLLNQPGPRLATAAERIAELLHPSALHQPA